MKKLAIISGASSGIGQKIAIDLAQQDFKCLLLGRDLTKLKDTQAQCSNSEIYAIDLQSESSILELSQLLLNKFLASNIDHIVLINNAGIVERESFQTAPLESWQRQFQTNLFGPVFLTQKLLPLLKTKNSAKIINISSTLGIKPIAETSAYSASKAAMNSWTQSLAIECAKDNIQVNAICPGIIETPLQSFYSTEDQKLRDDLNALQPLGRIGQPQDVSQVVQFLCDPKTTWMTGSLLAVDGGILLG